MNRLEAIAPDFARFLKGVDRDTRLFLKMEACCKIFPLLDDIQDEAVVCAKHHILNGDALPKELKVKLDDLADVFDGKYLPLYENDPKNESAYMPFFVKARALRALSSAGEDNSYESTADAIYEVSSALLDQNKLFDQLQKVIRRDLKTPNSGSFSVRTDCEG